MCCKHSSQASCKVLSLTYPMPVWYCGPQLLLNKAPVVYHKGHVLVCHLDSWRPFTISGSLYRTEQAAVPQKLIALHAPG